MTGLVKPKKYDWKDSNLSLFGSDTEKAVKKNSAEQEPAWAPAKQCTQKALFVWRIENFQVKPIVRENYGKFYTGDSYIVLNVFLSDDGSKLLYDVHFWIGKYSTADEYGTAAYKTVELDTLLDDVPIQHREVQGYESDLFKSYFPIITVLRGGCASGFRHVGPPEQEPRLLLFMGSSKGSITLKQITFTKKAINSNDVFVLDLGTEAIQFNGRNANKNERIHAAQYLQQLESERNGRCKTEVVDEIDCSTEHKFMKSLPEDVPYKERKNKNEVAVTKAMYRISDTSGKLNFTIVSEGTAPKAMLDDSDVFVVDSTKELFIYVGKNVSECEMKNAMSYAHSYLKETSHPFAPITVVSEAKRALPKNFESILD